MEIHFKKVGKMACVDKCIFYNKIILEKCIIFI